MKLIGVYRHSPHPKHSKIIYKIIKNKKNKIKNKK